MGLRLQNSQNAVQLKTALGLGASERRIDAACTAWNSCRSNVNFGSFARLR
jgi:hypothetical protein